jgi:hypothetical protein
MTFSVTFFLNAGGLFDFDLTLVAETILFIILALVVTNVRVTVGRFSQVGACGTVVKAANNDQTFPGGASQEFCIKLKLATESPLSTGHTDIPSLNVLSLTVIVLPVGVVPDAPQKAYCPLQMCIGSAIAAIDESSANVINSFFILFSCSVV